MRLIRFKIIVTTLFVCLGIGLLGVAVFAFQLGLDPSMNMGPMRQKLAVFAVFLILFPFLILLIGKINRRFNIGEHINHECQKWIEKLSRFFPNQSHSTPLVNRANLSDTHRINKNVVSFLFCTLGVVIVLIVSVWYITGGKMTHLTPYTHFFDMQADGFLAGQTALLVEPPEELAQLANPYDWKSREGFSYIWDASYFNGKYYIYWGPVPALLASLLKLIHAGIVEDQLLLLIFISGLTIVFSAFLYYLRKQYFKSVPNWTLLLFTLVFGFATPIFWLVNRPSVYETAIASCQLFLLLGIYAVVRGINSLKHQIMWLLLAGASLGAAVCSRVNVVLTVFFVFGVTAFILITQIKKDRSKIQSFVAFLAPLIVFAIALSWFNYTRFGSIFETGIHYQLTGGVISSGSTVLYSPWYVIPNIILSIFQPYTFSAHQFPFFKAISNAYWAGMVRMPNNHYNIEPVSGILFTIPVIGLLIVPILRQLKKAWLWINEKPVINQINAMPDLPRWLTTILIGSPAVSFVITILFVMMTMRYLSDFVPMFLLLTATLIMREIEHIKESYWKKRLLITSLLILGITGIFIGLLINFNNSDLRFQNINPVLFEHISQWFQ